MDRRERMKVAALVLALLLAQARATPAPPADSASPSFDVASVKPSASRDTAMRIIWPRGRFSAVNVSVRQFVEVAYNIWPFQVERAPAWFTDRFNIEATVGLDTPLDQPARGMPDAIRRMMQTLLADPFMCAVHWEKKSHTTYALMKARDDSETGPGLRRSDADCPSLFAAARRGGPLPTMALCGVQRSPGKLVAGAYSMSQLADTLSSTLQQIVVDRTGLTGVFDVDLAWAADPTTDAGPALFTALQEQLGLRLQAGKEPVDVLVVDRAQRPTPD